MQWAAFACWIPVASLLQHFCYFSAYNVRFVGLFFCVCVCFFLLTFASSEWLRSLSMYVVLQQLLGFACEIWEELSTKCYHMCNGYLPRVGDMRTVPYHTGTGCVCMLQGKGGMFEHKSVLAASKCHGCESLYIMIFTRHFYWISVGTMEMVCVRVFRQWVALVRHTENKTLARGISQRFGFVLDSFCEAFGWR